MTDSPSVARWPEPSAALLAQVEERNALLLRAEQQGYQRALREHGLGGYDDLQPEENP